MTNMTQQISVTGTAQYRIGVFIQNSAKKLLIILENEQHKDSSRHCLFQAIGCVVSDI